MESVKVKEMQIFDSKKKIAESDTRLKQQQNLYEACRADRNLYSKNLIEARVSITIFSVVTFGPDHYAKIRFELSLAIFEIKFKIYFETNGHPKSSPG